MRSFIQIFYGLITAGLICLFIGETGIQQRLPITHRENTFFDGRDVGSFDYSVVSDKFTPNRIRFNG